MAQVSTAVDFTALAERARAIRRDIVRSTTAAGSGHPTSSLSAVEILTALYFGRILRYDPQRPDWPDRDRFIMSKGHAAPALYAVLAEAGYFPVDDLLTLRKLGSPLQGHPDHRRLPAVEASTGSLGEGLSIGIGQALAGRLDRKDYRVFVMLGDGENDEGQVWEAAMAAVAMKLENLVAIVDHNQYQQTAAVVEVLDYTPLWRKWETFGWDTTELDGHDLPVVHKALSRARTGTGRPTCLVARTVKGKGVSFIEGPKGHHGRALTPDEAERALEELA